jgi:hypothetical protein
MTLSSIMDGPRGRRLLFELIVELSHAAHGGGYPEWAAGNLLWQAQYRFDPNRDRFVFMSAVADDATESNDDDADIDAPAEVALPEQLAEALARDCAGPLVAGDVRDALVESVDSARYWQEPDGRDILADTGAIRRVLSQALVILEESGLGSWWSQPMDAEAQVVVTMLAEEPVVVPAEEGSRPNRTLAERVAEWSRKTTEHEAQLVAEWDANPARSMSGSWWSAPAFAADSTTGMSSAWAGPVGLWAVEDGMGWETAQVASAVISANARVFEITGASAWAGLCARYPIDVTAQKRHDWRLTTNRDGIWVMPDWTAVAADYDAVHLTVLAYLSAAGSAISVGDDAASVIAGWGPDETYWLTDSVSVESTSTTWTRNQNEGWRPAN